jgi:hypothetical protein
MVSVRPDTRSPAPSRTAALAWRTAVGFTVGHGPRRTKAGRKPRGRLRLPGRSPEEGRTVPASRQCPSKSGPGSGSVTTYGGGPRRRGRPAVGHVGLPCRPAALWGPTARERAADGPAECADDDEEDRAHDEARGGGVQQTEAEGARPRAEHDGRGNRREKRSERGENDPEGREDAAHERPGPRAGAEAGALECAGDPTAEQRRDERDERQEPPDDGHQHPEADTNGRA